jgi:mannose-6-phosphate isomerase-like protein (cupin superfamily)
MYDQTDFTAAVAVRPDEAIESASLGHHRILVTGAMTGGALTIWEEIVEPGWGPPLHIHHREDEVFHVLEGRLRLWCGEERLEAGAGDTVVLPRGVPHRFESIGDTVARMLVVCTPGGFDRFFTDLDAQPGFGPAEIAASAERAGLAFVAA